MHDNINQHNTNQHNPQQHFPRGFKGVWIPADIWTHPELTWIEKCVAAEIDSLDNPEREPRGCYKSNTEFANEFGVTERHFRRMLTKLKKLGFVKDNGTDGRKRFLKGHSRAQEDVRAERTFMSGQGGHECPPREDIDVHPPLKPTYNIKVPIESTNRNTPPTPSKGECVSDPPSSQKKPYGEHGNVKLTEDQYGKLTEKVGETKRDDLIEQLDLYIGSKGTKYKDHYLTLLSWDRRKKDESKIKPKTQFDAIRQQQTEEYFKENPDAKGLF